MKYTYKCCLCDAPIEVQTKAKPVDVVAPLAKHYADEHPGKQPMFSGTPPQLLRLR